MKEPIFRSELGPGMQSFIEMRKSLGYEVRTLTAYLSHFDRYAIAIGYGDSWLSRSLVEGWIASTPLLKPSSRAHRLYVMRALGRYIVQTHSQSYLPPLIAGPKRSSTFRPHIYTAAEIKLLLDEAAQLTPTGSLRPLTFVTLLSLLYCAGLRISEALALRLSDVDLEAGVLLIRDSKFRKTRITPLAIDATQALSRYAAVRRDFRHRLDLDAPFFVNESRQGCAYPATIATFLGIARRVGIRGQPGTAGPRIHDLRHTFAVHRLLNWYRDGGDVQARLPLLTTYMGHVCLVSTQVYLQIAAELLQVAAQRFLAPQLCDITAAGGQR
jgi:integrase